jgi:hypothetical protein
MLHTLFQVCKEKVGLTQGIFLLHLLQSTLLPTILKGLYQEQILFPGLQQERAIRRAAVSAGISMLLLDQKT